MTSIVVRDRWLHMGYLFLAMLYCLYLIGGTVAVLQVTGGLP